MSYKILKLNIVIHAKKLNNLICFYKILLINGNGYGNDYKITKNHENNFLFKRDLISDGE